MKLLFRAVPQADCIWAEWAGDFAVHHRPSGKTHFVNDATALLLRQILAEPHDAPAAAKQLADAQGADSGPEFEQYVAGLLLRLEELGLVDRCTA